MSANIQLEVTYGNSDNPMSELLEGDSMNITLVGKDTSVTDSMLQNPIYIKQGEQSYSYERKFRLKLIDKVDVQEVKNFKIFSQNSQELELNPDTTKNVEYLYGSEQVYTTPTMEQSQIQTNKIPQESPQVQNLPINGDIQNSLTEVNDYTDYAVLQLKVHPTQNNSGEPLFVISWQEII